MAAREGADELKELRALKERHQATRSRADRLASQMEHENKTLQDLLHAYKEADEVLKRSQRA